MKKRINLLIAAVLIIVLTAGCAKGYDYSANESKSSSTYYSDSNGYINSEAQEGTAYSDGLTELSVLSAEKSVDLSEKIIYSANINIETMEFDDSVQTVYDLVERNGGFFENSYVSGNTYDAEYYGYRTFRNAEFTVRIPVAAYSSVTSAQTLSTIGNVTSKYESTDNITAQFYDTQSRLDTYKIEEERLLSMLEKTETVTDMIEIEARISEVRYNIESLQSQLKNWQNDVDYSTVTIYLHEVEKLTEIVDSKRGYWEEIGDGLKSTVKNIGEFFKDLFKSIVVNLPLIAIFAVVVVVAVVILKALFGSKAKLRKEIKKVTEQENSSNEPEKKE